MLIKVSKCQIVSNIKQIAKIRVLFYCIFKKEVDSMGFDQSKLSWDEIGENRMKWA